MIFRINTEFGDSLIFAIVRYVFLSFYLFMNIVLLVFIGKNRIASKTATILITTQTLFDALVIVLAKLVLVKENDSFSSYNKVYVIFYCYFLYDNTWFWTMVASSTYLMVSLTIDRFICIAFPLYYRRKKSFDVYLYIITATVCGFCTWAANNSFIITEVRSSNNTGNYSSNYYSCQVAETNMIRTIYFVAANLGPVIIVFTLNLISIYLLYRNSKTKMNINSARITINRKKTTTRFTIANFIGNTTYAVILTFDIFIFMLQITKVLSSYHYEVYVYFYPYVSGSLTIVNPLVYLIMFRNFRGFVLKSVGCCSRTGSTN